MKKYYKYVDDILNKKIVVCDSVFKTIKRFAKDINRQKDNNFLYFFDEKKVDKIIKFIESLKFSEQEYLDKNFILDDWQAFIIANIFGWYHKGKKTRRFKKAYIFVARGNGKSPLAAAIALIDLLKESGGQIYSIATNYAQSAIIYNYIKNFILKDKTLNKVLKIYAHSIENTLKFSYYRPLSSKFKGFDGFNPSLVIADEVSAMADYSLLNMFTTAMHKRSDSLLFMITTANYISDQSPGLIEYEYSKNILNNIINDEEYFALLYELDKKDNYRSTKNFTKPNPASFVNIVKLEKMLKEAENKKQILDSFLTKNLNKWIIGNQHEFVSYEVMSECQKNAVKYKNDINEDILLKNSYCSIGADFSNRRDLTSITFAFYIEKINKIKLEHLIFTTNLAFWQRTETIRNLFNIFIKEKDLYVCNGEYIDKEFVLHTFLEKMKKYDLINKTEFYFDEFGSIDYISIIENFVKSCIVVRQNLINISEHTKNYEEFLVKKMIIDTNKCALWQLGNARKYENNNLMKIQKENKDSERKIDTCISSLLALIGIKKYIQTEYKNQQIKSSDDLLGILKSLYIN